MRSKSPFLGIVAVLGLAGSTLCAAVQPEFAPAVLYSAGASRVATGDFNGDGFPDLAAVSLGGNSVSILLNQGDGSFGTPVGYQVGQAPLGIAVGDVNGDGKLDLVVANSSSLFLSVLLGNGDGTFATAQSIAVNLFTGAVAVADFNRDGKLDIASIASTSGGQNLAVLLGNGDGTFQSPTYYAAGVIPVALTVADFNRDGLVDLAVANQNVDADGYNVLLGNGDGTFKNAVGGKAGADPDAIVAADFNGDGILDLAVLNFCGKNANCGNGTISILSGKGDGTFQLKEGLALNYTAPTGLAGADVNGDGTPDLAVSYSVSNVGVLLNEGKARFTPETVYLVATYVDPQAIAISDLTRNGNPELVVGAIGSVAVLPNNGAFPAVSLSANALTFSSQLVNTPSPVQRVTVTDTGTAALSITSIAVSGNYLEQNPCGQGLGLQQSCVISIAFKPKMAGTNQGTVSITDNAPDSPQLITLTGTGTAVKLVPASLNFGNQKVGTSGQPEPVVLTNLGPQTISVQSFEFVGGGAADFSETSNCSGVPSGSSCTINVTFTPNQTGVWTATLRVYDTDRGSPQTVSLTGTGD